MGRRGNDRGSQAPSGRMGLARRATHAHACVWHDIGDDLGEARLYMIPDYR